MTYSIQAIFRVIPVTATFLSLILLVALLDTFFQLTHHFSFVRCYSNMLCHPWHLGDLWRSLLPSFLHFGLMHLLFNALSLWILGVVIERCLGSWLLLLLSILCGFISNSAQYFMYGPSFAGFSGILFGYIGFALVYHFWKRPLPIPIGFLYLSIAWLVLGWSGILKIFNLYTADVAHLAGCLSGACLAVICLLLGIGKNKKIYHSPYHE